MERGRQQNDSLADGQLRCCADLYVLAVRGRIIKHSGGGGAVQAGLHGTAEQHIPAANELFLNGPKAVIGRTAGRGGGAAQRREARDRLGAEGKQCPAEVGPWKSLHRPDGCCCQQ